ncbi:hypothetical protein QR680_010283 [Steinernema hermaphroditum]|uniref:ShKT domain-containing protein n=1 Tax=Steinernema hermaphroditum TaxID=289476 RepID=A0AA39IQA9_9BILA|nr:hypothetical protein QR680_010283 [Steinernema hermaphroditum]
MFSKVVIISTLLVFASAQETTPTTVAAGGSTVAPGPARCTDSAGNLLPTAQSCPDVSPDCASVFKTAATASPAARDPMCDMELLKETALKCSKTCAICCENPNYNCGDGVCPLSSTSTWNLFQPRATRRSVPLGKAPADRTTPASRTSWPNTCGLCMAGSCRDALPDCSKMGVLCNDITAGPIWKQQCARTCNSCPDTAAPAPPPAVVRPSPSGQCGASTCGDTRTGCSTFIRNGFCTNTWYEQAFRCKTCGRSCGWC